MTKKDMEPMLAPEQAAPAQPDTLAAALLRAQREIEAAAKDSNNKFHGYKYVSADAMVEHARSVLHENGLAFSQVGVSRIGDENAEPRHVEWMLCRYRLWHSATGTWMEVEHHMPAVPEKGRPHDKAVCGAMTVSLSYALRGLLLIPREDENEPDKRNDAAYTPPAQRQAAKPSAPTPAPAPKAAPSAPAKFDAWSTDKWPAGKIERLEGTFTKITSKPTKNGKLRYGFQFQPADGSPQFWLNAFSASANDAVKAAGDGLALVSFFRGEYGADLCSVEPATGAASNDDVPF